MANCPYYHELFNPSVYQTQSILYVYGNVDLDFPVALGDVSATYTEDREVKQEELWQLPFVEPDLSIVFSFHVDSIDFTDSLEKCFFLPDGHILSTSSKSSLLLSAPGLEMTWAFVTDSCSSVCLDHPMHSVHMGIVYVRPCTLTPPSVNGTL